MKKDRIPKVAEQRAEYKLSDFPAPMVRGKYAKRQENRGVTMRCHVGATIENHTDRKKSVRIAKLLVDTGSEHTWLPESTLDKIGVKREKKDISFMMANGTIVTRSIGFAIVRVDKYFTIDEVVFVEKGDLVLLGARTLEGLNLTINPTRKKLVAAGPIPAA